MPCIKKSKKERIVESKIYVATNLYFSPGLLCSRPDRSLSAARLSGARGTKPGQDPHGARE